MEGRIKHLFHRDRHESNGQNSSDGQQEPLNNHSSLPLKTSSYADAQYGATPDVGPYPKGGASASLATGRTSFGHARGHSTGNSRPDPVPGLASTRYEGQTASSPNDLSTDFSRLGVGNTDVSAPRLPIAAEYSRSDRELRNNHVDTPSQRVDAGNSHGPYGLSPAGRNGGTNQPGTTMPHHSALHSNLPDSETPREAPISRKQVGTSLPVAPAVPDTRASSSQPSASLNPNSSPSQNTAKSLRRSVMPGSFDTHGPDEYDTIEPAEPAGAGNVGDHVQRTHGSSGNLTGEEIIRRAQFNSADTEVVETIAPAVIHETVIKEIHHIRQEVITREIHNHDIYHRIQPIIDVEVLPTRHFLPVHGGGLVEVFGDQIPGRNKDPNWLVGETVSKIPSHEKPERRGNTFSARTFEGTEGDFKEYMTPEGYKRTEQTWIHPPVLEDGAKKTGQTWPLEFGNAAEKKPSVST